MSATLKNGAAQAALAKRSLERERESLFVRLQEINQALQRADPDARAPGKAMLANLRSSLGWSRTQLAQVMNASDRALVNWEAGDPISAVYAAKLREIQSICNELKHLMRPEEIGPWLLTETEEFEGRTPAELIRKGETGRLWDSLFYLRSGMPD